jgi:hypothetical protein
LKEELDDWNVKRVRQSKAIGNQAMLVPIIPGRSWLAVGGTLATLVLLLSLLLLHIEGLSPYALALDTAGALGQGALPFPTCATAPPDQQAHLCDHADPIAQGCEADAVTTQSIGLVDTQGQIVGRLDRRYSTRCNSFWARIFDYRATRPQGTVLVVQIGRDPRDAQRACGRANP